MPTHTSLLLQLINSSTLSEPLIDSLKRSTEAEERDALILSRELSELKEAFHRSQLNLVDMRREILELRDELQEMREKQNKQPQTLIQEVESTRHQGAPTAGRTWAARVSKFMTSAEPQTHIITDEVIPIVDFPKKLDGHRQVEQIYLDKTQSYIFFVMYRDIPLRFELNGVRLAVKMWRSKPASYPRDAHAITRTISIYHFMVSLPEYSDGTGSRGQLIFKNRRVVIQSGAPSILIDGEMVPIARIFHKFRA